MSTEAFTEATLILDETGGEAFREQVERLEAGPPSLVLLSAELGQLEALREALCTLRAANLPTVVSVRPVDRAPSKVELATTIQLLRDWDQLSLENLLSVASSWIPAKFLEPLQQEAKIESKWMKEWLRAVHDPRIAKVPGLPWRSYLRKTVGENFLFADALLERDPMGEGGENEMEFLFRVFLDRKKQAVNVFPKRWRRNGEPTH